MAFKSIKNKISLAAGAEILGETRAGEVNQPEPVVPKKEPTPSKPKVTRVEGKGPPSEPKETRPPKVKRPKKEKSARGFGTFGRKKETQEPEEELTPITPSDKFIKEENGGKINKFKDAVHGYEDVLSILGIKKHIELDVDFKSNQLDYVEFTQTQPLGFDFDEVTDFISRAKYTMYKLESALEQRDIDVVRLASEVKRVEQKMIDANQAKELERMIGGMTEEERLIEENMELKVQVNDLTRKIKNDNGNSEILKELNKQIEVLKAENNVLKMNNVSDDLNKLPSFKSVERLSEKAEENLFDNMLDDIGGLYDGE